MTRTSSIRWYGATLPRIWPLGFVPPALISDPTLRATGEALLAAEPEIYDLTGLLVDGTAHPFSRKDQEFSGKVQLDWHVSKDHLVYAGVSRGMKGGGFNTPTDGFDVADIDYVGFEPEILLAYELRREDIVG